MFCKPHRLSVSEPFSKRVGGIGKSCNITLALIREKYNPLLWFSQISGKHSESNISQTIHDIAYKSFGR